METPSSRRPLRTQFGFGHGHYFMGCPQAFGKDAEVLACYQLSCKTQKEWYFFPEPGAEEASMQRVPGEQRSHVGLLARKTLKRCQQGNRVRIEKGNLIIEEEVERLRCLDIFGGEAV